MSAEIDATFVGSAAGSWRQTREIVFTLRLGTDVTDRQFLPNPVVPVCLNLQLAVSGLEDQERVKALKAALKSRDAETLGKMFQISINDGYDGEIVLTTKDGPLSRRFALPHRGEGAVGFVFRVPAEVWHKALDAFSALLEP